MSGSVVTYVPRPEATPEAEVSALAAVYRIALSANQRDRLLDKGGPGDGTKVKEDSANEHRST